MSFILEALRKSEQERLRNVSPGMADLQARNRGPGRRYWLPLVIFLIGLNIGLLLFLWVNGTPPPGTPVAATPEAAPEVGTASTAPVAPPASNVATANPADEVTAAPATAAVPAPPPRPAERELSNELAPPPAPRNVTTANTGATDSSTTIAKSAAYSNLPTLEELTLAGSISLSPLHIDMHVFSPQRAERFVFINMNKYREGDSLREGPELTSITEDGVILTYQGRSFLVTRE